MKAAFSASTLNLQEKKTRWKEHPVPDRVNDSVCSLKEMVKRVWLSSDLIIPKDLITVSVLPAVSKAQDK